ncbi:MAG: hypothetical protein OXF27_00590 [Acidobacteria bacterium]|nr:hypothetical protein [Acidobacteriota bacterium]
MGRNGVFSGRTRGYGRTLLAACVLMLSAAPYAGAQEGLYAGAAAGWDRASAEYTKGIGLDVPPASYETATNDAAGGFGTVRASLGYRAFVAGRAYVSGEFEAAFHGGSGPAGYLREGTGVGDRDVWPGPWSVEKNHGLGANARLGYAAGGLLGEGGSVYFVTGVHWVRATVRRGSDIGGESIRIVNDHTLRPWVAGAGVEWGSLANRLGLEVRYSAAELEFRTGGDGSAFGMPRIDHTFGVREVSVQVGYTRSF